MEDLEPRFSRPDHGPETMAAPARQGWMALVPSADTGPGGSPGALGPLIDLFLCEAHWAQSQERSAHHLSGRRGGRAGGGPWVARRPGAGGAGRAVVRRGEKLLLARAGATFRLGLAGPGAPVADGETGARRGG